MHRHIHSMHYPNFPTRVPTAEDVSCYVLFVVPSIDSPLRCSAASTQYRILGTLFLSSDIVAVYPEVDVLPCSSLPGHLGLWCAPVLRPPQRRR